MEDLIMYIYLPTSIGKNIEKNTVKCMINFYEEMHGENDRFKQWKNGKGKVVVNKIEDSLLQDMKGRLVMRRKDKIHAVVLGIYTSKEYADIIRGY